MEEESKRRDCNGIQSLANETIIDILCRLSIESILTCKCVCKTWYALINDNYFSKLQLRIAKAHPSSRIIFEPSSRIIRMNPDKSIKLYLLDVQYCKVRKISGYALEDISYIFSKISITISSNLDGLICLAPLFTLDPVVIYNPLIRGDYMILPKTEISIACSPTQHVVLAFDPSINKYKAVRMLNYLVRSFNFCLCQVLTIGEGTSWRQVVPPYAGLISLLDSEIGGVFHKGSIYWIIDKSIVYVNGEANYSNDREYILEFDVTKEIFGVISLPESTKTPKYRQYNVYPCRFNLKWQILGESLALMEKDDRLLRIWRLVKQNGTVVVGYSKIRIESLCKDATISSLLCPNNTEDFLLLQTFGGYESKNGERKKTKGARYSYYYPYSKKNDRFVYLSNLSFLSKDNCHMWCFNPSLISIKAASLGHL